MKDSSSGMLRCLELRASDQNIHTYYELPPDTSSDAFRDASNKYQKADCLLQLQSDDPKFVSELDQSGLTEEQFRFYLNMELENAQLEMERLSKPHLIPSEEFLGFAADQCAQAARRTEQANSQIERLNAQKKLLGLGLGVLVVYASIVSCIAFAGPSTQKTASQESALVLEDAQTVSSPEHVIDKSVVYVTPKGKKYHKASCSILDGKTNLKEYKNKAKAEDDGYAPCGICFK